MSLNGIEGAKIKEAHASALEQPGAWFILHYLSRDEVDLLSSGSGGAAELKGAVASYQEASALYCFINYRARKVVIKYVPDGISRLLKARTAVHFTTVKEAFSPFDVTIDVVDPNGLSDGALAVACGFEPAPAEPTPPEPLPPSKAVDSTAKSEDASSARTERPKLSERKASSRFGTEHNVSESVSRSYEPSVAREPERHGHPHDIQSWLSNQRREQALPPEEASMTSRTASATPDLSFPSSTPKVSEERPQTSQDFRSDYASSFLGWKQKVKLFPRPVDDAKTQRPLAEEPMRQKLPSGLRFRHRKGEESTAKKPKSSRAKVEEPVDARPAPSPHRDMPRSRSRPILVPVAAESNRDAASVTQQPTIPAASPEPPAAATTSSKVKPAEMASLHSSHAASESRTMSLASTAQTETLSPEKQRLMKALQMRRAQVRAGSGNNALELIAAARKERDAMVSDPTVAQKADSGVDVDDGKDKAKLDTSANTDPSKEKLGEKPIVPEALTSNRSTPALDKKPENTEKRSDVGASSAEPIPAVMGPSPKVLEGKETGNATDLDRTTSSEHSILKTGLPKPSSSNTEDPEQTAEKRQAQAEKRRERLSPIRVDKAAEESDGGLRSDDSFLAELESATVQEARRVSLNLSPVNTLTSTPTSPGGANDGRRKPSGSVTSIIISSGSVRNKHEPTHSESGQQRSRPASPTTNSTVGEKSAAVRTTKHSSGLSRRVHALADLSRKKNTFASLDATASESFSPHSSFLAFNRESSLPQSSGPPTLVDTSVTGYRPTSSRTDSRGLSSRSRTQPADGVNVAQRPSMSSRHQGNEPSAMSITARIVKPVTRPASSSTNMGNSKRSGDMQQSVVTVERKPASRNVSPTRPATVSAERPMSRGSTLTARTRTSIDGAKRMFGMKSKESLVPPAPSILSMSNSSLDPVDERVVEERKQRRTNRFLKRMGIGPSPGRRRATDMNSPLGDEEEDPLPPRPSPVLVGDVNVQFPDSLLWKRRMAEIDSFGNLVLNAPKRADHARFPPKKYHLSGFKAPCIPPPGWQELSHSIQLDFNNGSTLQLACDDSVAHAQVLRRLTDAHQRWTTSA